MKKDMKWFKKPSKKTCVIALSLIIVILMFWVVGNGIFDLGGKTVEYTKLSKDDIPKSIETEVIPEYRELERALACLVEDKIYVIVTRGEKPTSGYEVSIEKMILDNKDGKNNLKVEALFTEPESGVSQSQVTTYPYEVSLTKLKTLPDSIELIIKY